MKDALLDSQQILAEFDFHMSMAEKKCREVKNKVEVEAYRQLTDKLAREVNVLTQINAKLEYVFKKLGINPREHKAWAEKIE